MKNVANNNSKEYSESPFCKDEYNNLSLVLEGLRPYLKHSEHPIRLIKRFQTFAGGKRKSNRKSRRKGNKNISRKKQNKNFRKTKKGFKSKTNFLL